MLKGTVGFASKKGNFISKAIRWFTQSKWSHTFIMYQVEPEALVVEAGTFEVLIDLPKKYDTHHYVTAYFEPVGFSGEEIEKGISKIRQKIEVHYGWLQLVGFIPVVIFKRLFGKKISNPAKGGIICSELVLLYLRALEPGAKWDHMDKNTTSPEDLFVEISGHPKFKLMPTPP